MKTLIESEEASRERLDRMLHGLPPRRAPATLESRVLEELQRRAALPWWRRGFGHWPAAARTAFVALCATIIGASFLGDVGGLLRTRAAHEMLALASSWMHPAAAALASMLEIEWLLWRLIPPAVTYGFLAAAALLYAALFGLGATAYRALHPPSAIQGSLP
jgi:hypothetical protein